MERPTQMKPTHPHPNSLGGKTGRKRAIKARRMHVSGFAIDCTEITLTSRPPQGFSNPVAVLPFDSISVTKMLFQLNRAINKLAYETDIGYGRVPFSGEIAETALRSLGLAPARKGGK